ncbi:MAG: adenosylcobinamide amidohydrolase [Desulfobacteraceae bacterium]|nr:adenosylcobinamide amidohydrolase [Desulfobacteraceae bacterium]
MWTSRVFCMKGKVRRIPARRVAGAIALVLLACTVLSADLPAFAGSGEKSARDRGIRRGPVRIRLLDVALDYVRSAQVIETESFGARSRTLIVDFKEPQRVLSTLEGERGGILSVGNHYFPPSCWSIPHEMGFERWKEYTIESVGKKRRNSSFLFTGADMSNLSLQRKQFGDLTVYALVTAGVESNAMRASREEGLFYEPGTINIVLLTNGRLTSRAMCRTVIAATEAKTAALQDLDVRSAGQPLRLQATGTGTDEMVVVEGAGKRIDVAGGHSRMGELIARAVYDGVREAVRKQNGIVNPRSVMERLKERKIDLRRLVVNGTGSVVDGASIDRLILRAEAVLSKRRYASFIESALALSDAYESGSIGDLEAFRKWCGDMAREIAEGEPGPDADYVGSGDIPVVLRMSLNAILSGVFGKEKDEEGEGRP